MHDLSEESLPNFYTFKKKISEIGKSENYIVFRLRHRSQDPTNKIFLPQKCHMVYLLKNT